jgi:hypothetical protein
MRLGVFDISHNHLLSFLRAVLQTTHRRTSHDTMDKIKTKHPSTHIRAERLAKRDREHNKLDKLVSPRRWKSREEVYFHSPAPSAKLPPPRSLHRCGNQSQLPAITVVYDGGVNTKIDDHTLRDDLAQTRHQMLQSNFQNSQVGRVANQLSETIINTTDPMQMLEILVARYKKLMQQPGPKSKGLVAKYRQYKSAQKQLQRRGKQGKFKGHDRRKQRTAKERHVAHGV